MTNNVFKSKLTISPSSGSPSLATGTLFDTSHVESTKSPIDQFLDRLHSINQLAPPPHNFDPLQGQLVLLGVIAAVESYLRTLFRRLINIDDICKSNAYKRDISYGAAIHLHKDMLPEAILERISFISKDSIIENLRDILGIKGTKPALVDSVISDYIVVCQLRHCAVHRFGRLGVSNAIALGIETHKEVLEKPLLLNYTALQTSILICTSLVKVLNEFIFNELISRVPETSWNGSYSKDKKLLNKYYNIFSDTKSSLGATASSKDIHEQLMKQIQIFLDPAAL